MPGSSDSPRYRRRHLRQREPDCPLCGRRVPFCWSCRCGFRLCQACMHENFWTLSCNGITWVCPDCGQQNGLGNQ